MLCIHNLTFERNQTLFAKLNETVNPGDIIQIRGANGSGKTTLLRILACLIEPHQGKITWNDLCIAKHRETYLENVIYIGHLNGTKPNLTVYENLSLNGILTGCTPQKLNNVIEKAGLEKVSHKRAHCLSAGQLRRLCLARLMLTPRPLWLLDEPHTALDSDGQLLLNLLLKEHVAQQGIAMIATHQVLTLNHSMKTIMLGDQHAC